MCTVGFGRGITRAFKKCAKTHGYVMKFQKGTLTFYEYVHLILNKPMKFPGPHYSGRYSLLRAANLKHVVKVFLGKSRKWEPRSGVRECSKLVQQAVRQSRKRKGRHTAC